jgi:hypothetical protein
VLAGSRAVVEGGVDGDGGMDESGLVLLWLEPLVFSDC